MQVFNNNNLLREYFALLQDQLIRALKRAEVIVPLVGS